MISSPTFFCSLQCQIMNVNILIMLTYISYALWFYCFSLPLQIGVALYLLYTQVKFAFVSGLAITILLIPGRTITQTKFPSIFYLFFTYLYASVTGMNLQRSLYSSTLHQFFFDRLRCTILILSKINK